MVLTPVIGEFTYLPGQLLCDTQTLDIDAPPLQLHAWKLAFTHPRTGDAMNFEADLPDWSLAL